ncbi:hypothetical protein Taro_042436 [Colocasia esculenta]|uniref:Ribosome maturation factor RimM n=1 Tax=Colocasia esculenta TaxID=4460 RepID=A0A843WDZ6_COLES|nr:hypothetical protein [Colocasia esculenta]
MQFPTSTPVLPQTTPLPLVHCPRPFLGALCLRRRPRPSSASSPAPSPASWRFGRKDRAFPPCYVVGGADVDESVRGGGAEEEEEDVEVEEGVGSEFIEVGYISSVHGLKGEVRVKPRTDFPELRFAEPGRRWLRTYVSGKGQVREVELMGGRSHPGQKTWILNFSGVDTVDKAKQIVGSTILVEEDDRPELDEGEFYTSDLFGMKVILKETGKHIGTVVNVVNYGSSDLLQVMLNTAKGSSDDGALEPKGSSFGRLVWVPFVEAIVPEVDEGNREMYITPPKGLLELNIRSDTRSKKERRQMEWKQRKKLQQHISSAKKKLAEIGQEHVLRGLSYGVKDQKRLLANQIADINLKLFQHATADINKCIERSMYPSLLHAKPMILTENSLQISRGSYNVHPPKEIEEDHYALHAKGLHLVSECKVAIILILDCKRTFESMSSLPEEATSPFLQLQNIWFFEEEKLPVVNITPDDQNRHKILLRSPWEIIQSPVGPGGIFSSLSSHKIVDILNEMHVEYVQVCNLDERCALAHPLFLGLVSSRKVNVGIKIFTDQWKEDEIDMIFATKYLSMLTEQVDKLQFYAVPVQNKHTELVDDEWIDPSYACACEVNHNLEAQQMEKKCVPEGRLSLFP